MTIADILRALVTGDGTKLRDNAWVDEALAAIQALEDVAPAVAVPQAAPAGPDPRDAEIAALEARIAELTAAAEGSPA